MRDRLDQWKFADFAPGVGVATGVFAADYDDTTWQEITIPGDTHQALIAAGRISDPFYDRNEFECAWVQDREWWYRCTFDGLPALLQSDERIQLVFHGLDTFATIWLNGVELGRSRNMFREAVFDVSSALRVNQANTLAICFDRPLDHIDGMNISNWDGTAEPVPRVAMRKAQFGYGWDWGPILPTVGIWRPVELRHQQCYALTGVHFATTRLDRDQEYALVEVSVEVDCFATDSILLARITLSDADQEVATQTVTIDGLGANLRATAFLRVDQPRLWWTHDLGEPALYTLTVTVEQEGLVLAEQVQQVGIRTITLDQSPDPDEPGTRFFRFMLNGVSIFARGADWIPADSFVATIPAERYAMWIAAAREANMNMLRVWGGGIYEHDVFYDLCDQQGILVWQDFMFACAMYPEDNATFVAEVAAEAEYQVRRLRSHPSMALWCGNNENQWIYGMRNWERPDYQVPGSLYYNTILPQAVATWDGYVPYWPGSPFGGSDDNSAEDGDRHNWEVWHGQQPRRFGQPSAERQTPEGVSFRHYAEDMGRFISEFGMHAAPVYETLRRVIPADQLYFHSPSMDHHNKDNPKNKGDNLMMTSTGLPTTLEEYIDFSMIAQAEGLKFGIEHYRRRKPHCAGTLFWQLNDCWPVLSWSVMDYYGAGKAGYYYARRVYAPVLASFKECADGAIELWLTNDRLTEVSENITVRLGSFGAGILWEETRELAVAANSSSPVWRWTAAELAGTPERYLTVSGAGGAFPTNRHFFAAIKDLQRDAVVPTSTIEQIDAQTLAVVLSNPGPGYVFFAHLLVADSATQFSDNYFDLAPGDVQRVIVTNQHMSLTPDMLTVRWR